MNVSDIIEKFLLDTLGDELSVNFNRNELATYFAVAPSQINYVLATRFTPERGYMTESRRGGGGYITLIRVSQNVDDVLTNYIDQTLSDGIDYGKACQILERLTADGIFTENEAQLIKAAISDKALLAPTVAKNKLRGSILKCVLLETLKTHDDGE
ncbi:MAG: CtsR family transcriptional regulator [Clostridiales bacterium]|nr:CtsR family transcriptional regulator [Clostridiales bacterium]MDE6617526.1 CtsR family transcriptional regulator [Clostridiales bacterium]MDE7107745.1 CtsR family transcriptional regulator [Clostridiales bacterium]